MQEITLENYRCFKERQTARLAPLTLLVGENSTGKTSFMAMIQALLDFANEGRAPDFKKYPYDLGSFDETTHYRGGHGDRAGTFKAGFTAYDVDLEARRKSFKDDIIRFDVEFGHGSSTVPVPTNWRLSNRDAHIKIEMVAPSIFHLSFGASNDSWKTTVETMRLVRSLNGDQNSFPALLEVFHHLHELADPKTSNKSIEVLRGTSKPASKDWKDILGLAEIAHPLMFNQIQSVFAIAPVRSKPHRTYDPAGLNRDPEGDYVPMYLANQFFENKNDWNQLRKSLTKFGQESGLFDEISIKPLGKQGSEPFQLQIRKYGSNAKGRTGAKGPSRNLIDVGYGVSQVLPIFTELSRNYSNTMYLMQQPEAHLHPSAQAALGSFFCRIAQPGRALVVETHSDYILDRVRMDVRDGKSKIKPEDVSILFFEHKDLGAQIHSLSVDDQGNILNAPNRYRKFFMEETRRSLGL